MPRDYVCALCGTRYSFIPPNGCHCTEEKFTVYHDGKESQQIREKEQREQERQKQKEREQELERKRKAQEQKHKEHKSQQRHVKSSQKKPTSSSSSNTGVTIGFIAFVIATLYFRYEESLEWMAAAIAGFLIGVLVRYTYKYIIGLLVIALAIYIYNYFNEEEASVYEVPKTSTESTYTTKKKSPPVYEPEEPELNIFAGNPTVQINRVWTTHNHYIDGKKGLKIHIDFNAIDMQNEDGLVVAWFEFEDGTALKDYNNRYKTVNGNVSSSENFNPDYQNSNYSDFVIFMPYDELHINKKGTYSLRYSIGVFHDNEQLSSTYENQYFEISYD